MVRAPCCEKMGLKKGPWTPEEDHILINYIRVYGHGNWRALPKQAGLLRCGKSCRLRWTNYLRPDIKRGHFTREEEDTIIQLHEMLGNRWSAIAARLPGRTDNEIKNVWHTHLKKRLKQSNAAPEAIKCASSINDVAKVNIQEIKSVPDQSLNLSNVGGSEGSRDQDRYRTNSPQQCSSDMSSVTTGDTTSTTTNNMCTMKVEEYSSDGFPEIDENFWSEVLSADNSSMVEAEAVGAGDLLSVGGAEFPFSPLVNFSEPVHATNSNVYDNMDFWYDIFTGDGGLPGI